MAKKRRSKKRKHVKLSMADYVNINFHPTTGANLKGRGAFMHKKTGKVHYPSSD